MTAPFMKLGSIFRSGESMETRTLKFILKRALLPIIRSRGLTAFTQQLPKNARLLDVGCGNFAPLYAKTLRPDLYYVGLDIDGGAQPDIRKTVVDEYHLTRPEVFDEAISAFGSGKFDAVICAHNIEHTQKPFQVLEAICNVLRPTGRLYLSFPSEKTSRLPHRKGTLNFYDDVTHVWLPPFNDVIVCLQQNGIDVIHQIREYHPLIYSLIGMITEPYSAFSGRLGPLGGTWALYGFESIIWGEKPALPTDGTAKPSFLLGA